MTPLDQFAASSIAERQSLPGGSRRVHRLAFVDACTEERVLRLLAVLEAAQRFVVDGESADSAVAIRVAVAAAAADPLLAPTIGDDVIPNVGKP